MGISWKNCIHWYESKQSAFSGQRSERVIAGSMRRAFVQGSRFKVQGSRFKVQGSYKKHDFKQDIVNSFWSVVSCVLPIEKCSLIIEKCQCPLAFGPPSAVFGRWSLSFLLHAQTKAQGARRKAQGKWIGGKSINPMLHAPCSMLTTKEENHEKAITTTYHGCCLHTLFYGDGLCSL
jgi:hypothetical protein